MGERVSVVIPVYNREDTIERAIKSVLAQTYTNIELLVVDDCSDDNTREIINAIRDNRLRLICQRQRKGANAARNVGIEKSTGEYIAFQDSDDEWMPDKLERQLDVMKTQNFFGCYCAFYYWNNGKRTIIPPDYKCVNKYQTGLKEIMKCYNVVGTPTLIINRQVLNMLDNQYFDEEMPRMQDFDFALRLLQRIDLAYVDEPLVNAYKTKTSISTNNEALYYAAARLVKKHGNFLDVKSLLNVLINNVVFRDSADNLIKGLNIVQEEMRPYGIDCKDAVLERIYSRVTLQEQLLLKQYEAVENNLKDNVFAIYGAGEIGQKAYRQLKNKGLRPACFLVTKYDGTKYVEDIPVLSIDEYDNRNDMVIIGISEKNQLELINNLMQRKYRQFCVYKETAV